MTIRQFINRIARWIIEFGMALYMATDEPVEVYDDYANDWLTKVASL